MILFDLKCECGHVFEGWFKDSQAFAEQETYKEINCPLCNSCEIKKAPMAPRLGRLTKKSKTNEASKDLVPAESTGVSTDGASQGGSPDMAKAGAVYQALKELKDHIVHNCEYVGDRFVDEIRDMHYGESEERGIYGEATPEEAMELSEEGITYVSVPWLKNKMDS